MSVETPARQHPKGGRPPGAHAAKRPAQHTRRAWWQGPWLIVGSVVTTAAVVGAFILVGMTRGESTPAAAAASVTPNPRASANIVAPLSGIDPALLEAAGTAGTGGSLQGLKGTQVRRDGSGKPLVFYAGADYCPYCAAQRWSLVVALSRFGTFSNLGITTSSSTDIFPDTATLSFSGSAYSSDYVAFSGLETEDHERRPLDTPTALQQQILSTYDMPPYVSSARAIPLIDIADRYLLSGAGYSPRLLAGMTWQQIADAIHSGQGAAAQGVLGEANVLTAAVCRVTGDQPASACASPTIRAIEQRIQAAGG